MTGPRPDTTTGLPSRILSPDEYEHAQTLSPEDLKKTQFPILPAPLKPIPAQKDAVYGATGTTPPGEENRPKLTGAARILTQYVAAPLWDHPIMTVASVLPPVALYYTSMMAKDVAEYAAQKTAELSLPAYERKLAEKDPNRISGEQAAVEGTMLAAAPLLHEAIKRGRAARGVPAPGEAVPAGSPQAGGTSNQLAAEAVGLEPSTQDLSRLVPEGKPGVAVEPYRPDAKIIKVASRDANGKPNGLLVLSKTGEKTADVFTAFVDPKSRRQGIGTALYDAAEAHGLTLRSGQSGYTPEGKAFVEKRTGGPAPVSDLQKQADQLLAPQVAQGQSIIKGHVDRVVDSWKTIFAPATRSTQAAQAASILRATTGEMARTYEQASFKLDEFRRAVEPLPDADKLGFIDAIEGGKSQASPEFQEAANTIRTTLDTMRDQIRALGTGKLDNFIEDYFPHIWTDPERATDAFAAAYSKRPMEGGKAFLKERTIPTTAEGMAMGLTPVSTNPVDLTLLKLREMQRYYMAHSSLKEMKDAGLVKYVVSGGEIPAGHTRINDKIATVFGPRQGGVELPEGAAVSSDPLKPPSVAVRDATGKLRRNLSNVADEHLQAEWNRLAELNNAEEGIHASVQESGYRAKYEELPRTERLGKKGQEDLPDADGNIDPEVLASHNKIIRDYNRSQIVRAARTKAMERIETEMAGRPSADDFNFGANAYHAGTPGLRPMRQSDVKVLGTRIMGEYWAPEPVAKVVNNYLSPGLRGNAIYDAYRGLGNTLNQAQLGLSAFHLMFTSMDASVSRAALGLEYITGGSIGRGFREMLSAPVAPVTNMRLGAKIRSAYLDPEHASPDMRALANAVAEAGGRVKMDSFYKNSAPERMIEAWRNGEYGKAIGLSLPALFEFAAKPIMEHIVPMQKLGVFGDLAKRTMDGIPPDASLLDRRQALGDAWNSVDNRMGQLVYDNLFWSKSFKDLAMASVRSVGWNIGTIRELGGGIVDVAGNAADLARGRATEMSHKAAYVIALPMTVGFYGAIYQYLRTGEGPQEMKDYFYPKTGEVDADGNPERVQIASYMKDFFAYSGHPWETVKHKLNPMLSTTYEMLQNEDFYGDMIRNPEDPFVQQIAQEAGYVAKQVVPFSFRNMSEQSKRGDQTKVTKIGSWFGITPAPRSEVRTEAQNRMMEYLGHRKMSGSTPEDAEARQTRSEILRGMRGNTSVKLGQAVTDAIERHQLTAPDVAKLLKRAGLTPAQEQFKRLTLVQAVDVFKRANRHEKELFAEALLNKVMHAQAQAGQ